MNRTRIAFLTLVVLLLGTLAALIRSRTGSKEAAVVAGEQTAAFEAMRMTLQWYERLAMIDADVFVEGSYSNASDRYRALMDSAPGALSEAIRKRLTWLTARSDRQGDDATELLLAAQRNERMAISDMENALLAMRQRLEFVEDSAADEIDRLKLDLASRQKEVERLNRIQVISFTGPKGSKVHYMGEVKDGKANGGGVGIWTTGSVYRGQWRNNLRHGEGTFEWADGERYEGTYVDGVRTGFGKYYWPSGDRYEGQWKGDRRNGQGTLFDMDGNIRFKGTWKEDKPVERAGDAP